MRVRYLLKTRFSFDQDISRHVFRLRAYPVADNRQRVLSGSLAVMPAATCAELTEPPHGNRVFAGRIDEPHDAFAFESRGIAEIRPDHYDTRRGPQYLVFPTHLTAPGNGVRALAGELGACDLASIDGLLRAAGVVHRAIDYTSGVTGTNTSAEEALALGRGVCQDYSHVLLSLLRLKGVSCRYVAGLVAGIGQTHAWVEVWLDGRWVSIDPTYDKACDTGYLVLARGADFSEAAIEKGVFRGVASQTIDTRAELELLD